MIFPDLFNRILRPYINREFAPKVTNQKFEISGVKKIEVELEDKLVKTEFWFRPY